MQGEAQIGIKMSIIVQRITNLAPTLRSLSARQPAVYYAAERYMTNFKDKERGEELVHFRKEDEKLLRKLLEKVKAQADKVMLEVPFRCPF